MILNQNRLNITGIGCPSEVLFNPFLTNTEQKIFGFIRSLAQTSKGCFASNSYIAEIIFAGSAQTVSNSIAKLKEYCYLNVIFQNTRNGQVRRIFINEDYVKIYRPVVEAANSHIEAMSDEYDDSSAPISLKDFLSPLINQIIAGYKQDYNYKDNYIVSSKEDIKVPEEPISLQTNFKRKTPFVASQEKQTKTKKIYPIVPQNHPAWGLLHLWNNHPACPHTHKTTAN